MRQEACEQGYQSSERPSARGGEPDQGHVHCRKPSITQTAPGHRVPVRHGPQLARPCRACLPRRTASDYSGHNRHPHPADCCWCTSVVPVSVAVCVWSDTAFHPPSDCRGICVGTNRELRRHTLPDLLTGGGTDTAGGRSEHRSPRSCPGCT